MKGKEAEKRIEMAKKKDPDAFTELMQFYMKDMYRVALAILMNDEDAADAVQDTILACWEKMGTLKYNQYVKTWIIRILINKCYKIRKYTGYRAEADECGEPAVYDEYNLELKEALSSLDEKYRIVMAMYYGGGYPVNEIARILKIPKSTVQTRLQRGRGKLARDYYGIERTV